MPDITMCINDDCPLRHSCYRYMATPSYMRQAYCNFTPKKNAKGKVECEHFLKIYGYGRFEKRTRGNHRRL